MYNVRFNSVTSTDSIPSFLKKTQKPILSSNSISLLRLLYNYNSTTIGDQVVLELRKSLLLSF